MNTPKAKRFLEKLPALLASLGWSIAISGKLYAAIFLSETVAKLQVISNSTFASVMFIVVASGFGVAAIVLAVVSYVVHVRSKWTLWGFIAAVPLSVPVVFVVYGILARK